MAAGRPRPATSQQHRASVAVGFVTGMLSGLKSRNIDYGTMLHSAGIPLALIHDSAARVRLDAYARLYNNVVRDLDDEGFALFSAPLRSGTFEFLCRSVLGSHTLAEVLERAVRFLHLVLPDLVVSIKRTRLEATIEIHETGKQWLQLDDPRRIFAFEWLLRLLHGLACWIVARELTLTSVQFPYPKPAHSDDYSLIYTPRSMFGGEGLMASLNPNLLDLPTRRDESDLIRFLDGAPGKISILYRRDRETVHRVRDFIAQALPHAVSINDVAPSLSMTTRTLHRRLMDEGSSFRAIKEALRRDLALSLLEKTNQPIAKIAEDLGYSEPSTFFRAFQSWTGMSPTAYRSRLNQTGVDKQGQTMHSLAHSKPSMCP